MTFRRTRLRIKSQSKKKKKKHGCYTSLLIWWLKGLNYMKMLIFKSAISLNWVVWSPCVTLDSPSISLISSVPYWLFFVPLWSGLPAVQPAMVEDPPVCVGACALRYLGRRFYHLHDQHLRRGAVPAHRLPGGGYTAAVHFPSLVPSELWKINWSTIIRYELGSRAMGGSSSPGWFFLVPVCPEDMTLRFLQPRVVLELCFWTGCCTFAFRLHEKHPPLQRH